MADLGYHTVQNFYLLLAFCGVYFLLLSTEAESHGFVSKQMPKPDEENHLISPNHESDLLREAHGYQRWFKSSKGKLKSGETLKQTSVVQGGFKCNKSSFAVVWNVPTHHCRDYHKDIDKILTEYSIIHNPYPSTGWWGPEIILIYSGMVGLYPSILKNGSFVHGGIPQLGNLTAHLEKTAEDIKRLVPDPNFRGLGVIDWESWRPIWERNFDSLKIYQNASMDHIKSLHPMWSHDQIVAEAKREFEQAAREYMEGTVRLLKKLRPGGKYGYYGFPECSVEQGVRHCDHHQQRLHNELLWMFNASSVTFPSVYLRSANETHNKDFIHDEVGEALRIQRKVYPHSLQIFLYASFRDFKTGQYVAKENFQKALRSACYRGMDGVVLWDDHYTSRTNQNCTELLDDLNNVIGPVVNSLK